MKKICKIIKASIFILVLFLICKDAYFICKTVFYNESKIVILPNGQEIDITNTDTDMNAWEEYMVENGCKSEQIDETLHMTIGDQTFTITPRY